MENSIFFFFSLILLWQTQAGCGVLWQGNGSSPEGHLQRFLQKCCKEGSPGGLSDTHWSTGGLYPPIQCSLQQTARMVRKGLLHNSVSVQTFYLRSWWCALFVEYVLKYRLLTSQQGAEWEKFQVCFWLFLLLKSVPVQMWDLLFKPRLGLKPCDCVPVLWNGVSVLKCWGREWIVLNRREQLYAEE